MFNVALMFDLYGVKVVSCEPSSLSPIPFKGQNLFSLSLLLVTTTGSVHNLHTIPPNHLFNLGSFLLSPLTSDVEA
ncbi:hypothetical protein VNO77_04370 [Canavalia gladiata]|uniref:Uncharacterized protein n=1 Tax=Canavalia gladiata TaxID=3824 RepID=A0AAN9MWE1_CANGL